MTDQPQMKTYANGSHALVIGSSMAGLLAARVLTDHFDRVTIIERDRLPATAEFRKGVPQAHHVHILLARGQQILDHLFPDLKDQLLTAGAIPVDLGEDAAVLTRGGWSPRYHSGIGAYAASRPLLEWSIQQRLAAHPKVRFVEGAEAKELLCDDHRSRVTGVRVHWRGQSGDESFHANLVVDASGRSSDAPEWLERLGYPRPQETVVNSFLGYSTRWYRRPAGFQAQWKLLLIGTRPPRTARGGVIFPVEGDRWVVTLGGAARDYPPTDETGFMAFARSLTSPLLYEAIQDAEPLTPIYGYQRTANQIRHYERLERWPEQFVLLGDAVCAFNPVYGQGMSVAAMGALALDECLREFRPNRTGMAQVFQKRLAQVNETPWLLATGEDFRYPETEGGKRTWVTRLIHWYVDQMLLAIPNHQDVADTFLKVSHLVEPSSALFQPRIVRKALGRALRQLSPNGSGQDTVTLPPHWQTEQKVSTF